MKIINLVWMIVLLSSLVIAVPDPDFLTENSGIFYTNNENAAIYLNFSENVQLIKSELSLTQSAAIIPVNYSMAFSDNVLVSIGYPYLAFGNRYTYLLNAQSKKGTQLDEEGTYFIILDNIAPQVRIYPNNLFFTDTLSSNLTFNISFNEKAKLNKVLINNNSFTDFSNNIYDIVFFKKPQYMINSSKNLFISDGIKNVFVEAEDLAGNLAYANSVFEINENPELVINLLSPKYGKSSKYDFNFIIGTDNSGKCKYKLDQEGLLYSTLSQKLNPSISGTAHSSTDFSLPDESEHFLWVSCYDPYYGKESYEKILISVDTSPPTFESVRAVPNKIVEPPLTNEPDALLTTIYVNTNEDTICRFDEAEQNFYQMSDEFNQPTLFSKIHSVKINISSDETKTYYYFVSCINEAELQADSEQVSFLVDLNANLEILQITPHYVNSTVVNLKIKTNKNSTCTFSLNNTLTGNELEFSKEDGYNFEVERVVGGMGNYSYYAFCDAKRTIESVKHLLFFIVDLTPPEIPLVDDSSPLDESEFYYSNKSLRVKYNSSDAESGIDHFTYAVIDKNTNENVTKWFTDYNSLKWGTFFFIQNLDLINLNYYYIRAYATNKAGLVSLGGDSNGVTVDLTKIPDYCSNSVIDEGKESDVDCGITCPLCGADKTCFEDNDCISLYCKSGTCTQATCNDGIKNQGEGDVDCGGEYCNSCSNGKTCNQNEDCSVVSSCYDRICKHERNHCKNRVIDGGETALNCGGDTCDACLPGKSCLTDNDCTSNDCREGVCNEATCSDDFKNQDESDVDCGGEYCNSCNVGFDCIKDRDCESQNCIKLECNKLSFGDWAVHREKIRKLILFVVLFLVTAGILSGGTYYAYIRGYIKKETWNKFLYRLKNLDKYVREFDWKNFKFKKIEMPKIQARLPSVQRKISPEEQKRRKEMMAEKVKHEREKKYSQRKNIFGEFEGEKPKQEPFKPKKPLINVKKNKQEDSLFSELDKISEDQSEEGHTQNSLKSLEDLAKEKKKKK